jgi:hypothetical protein
VFDMNHYFLFTVSDVLLTTRFRYCYRYAQH